MGAVASIVGDYAAQHKLLGNHADRYIRSVGRQCAPTPYSKSVRVLQLCHAWGCYGLQAGAAAELRARRLCGDV